MVVANKCDLADNLVFSVLWFTRISCYFQEVPHEDGRALAESSDALFFRCSATENSDVAEIFSALGRLPVLRELLTLYSEVPKPDLLQAITEEDVSKVAAVIDSGVSVNEMSIKVSAMQYENLLMCCQHGVLPLHLAVNIGNVEMIKLLLDRGAGVDLPDKAIYPCYFPHLTVNRIRKPLSVRQQETMIVRLPPFCSIAVHMWKGSLQPLRFILLQSAVRSIWLICFLSEARWSPPFLR